MFINIFSFVGEHIWVLFINTFLFINIFSFVGEHIWVLFTNKILSQFISQLLRPDQICSDELSEANLIFFCFKCVREQKQKMFMNKNRKYLWTETKYFYKQKSNLFINKKQICFWTGYISSVYLISAHTCSDLLTCA